MGFNPITQFSKAALAQLSPRRRFFSDWHNQQCWPYAPSRRCGHQLTRGTGVSESPTLFSSGFYVMRRYYSSKPSNPRTGLLSWYLGMLESRPILTKSVSSAIIYAAADVTSQHITKGSEDSWNSVRTLRMTAFGLILLGPSQHVWFNFVAGLFPKRDVVSTFKKMAMGQLCFAPLVNGGFFSFNAAFQGESVNEIAARLKRDLIPTLLNGLMYWPMCDFLTYKVIPVHLQPLLNSSFSYLWTIYLTYMASLAKATSV